MCRRLTDARCRQNGKSVFGAKISTKATREKPKLAKLSSKSVKTKSSSSSFLVSRRRHVVSLDQLTGILWCRSVLSSWSQQRNDVTKNDDDKQEEAKTMIGMTTTQGPMANEAWLDEEVTKACEDLSLSQPPFEAATTEEQEQGNDVRYSHIKYWIDWSRTHQVLTQNTKNLVVQ